MARLALRVFFYFVFILHIICPLFSSLLCVLRVCTVDTSSEINASPTAAFCVKVELLLALATVRTGE